MAGFCGVLGSGSGSGVSGDGEVDAAGLGDLGAAGLGVLDFAWWA